jgi:hypothetical protein
MSDDPAALRALADRIEHEAPSRALDAEIWNTIGLLDNHERHCRDWCRQNRRSDLRRGHYLLAWAPEFTSDLDAATTLMPGKLYWILDKGRTRPDEPLYGARAFRPGEDVPIGEAETNTGAAALCAAALRARATMVGDNADG